MTRQRKEIIMEAEQLRMERQAEYDIGCGMFDREISDAFAPEFERLYEKWAKTYGMTIAELNTVVYDHQLRAYERGLIPWSPCYGDVM